MKRQTGKTGQTDNGEGSARRHDNQQYRTSAITSEAITLFILPMNSSLRVYVLGVMNGWMDGWMRYLPVSDRVGAV